MDHVVHILSAKCIGSLAFSTSPVIGSDTDRLILIRIECGLNAFQCAIIPVSPVIIDQAVRWLFLFQQFSRRTKIRFYRQPVTLIKKVIADIVIRKCHARLLFIRRQIDLFKVGDPVFGKRFLYARLRILLHFSASAAGYQHACR